MTRSIETSLNGVANRNIMKAVHEDEAERKAKREQEEQVAHTTSEVEGVIES